MAVTIYPAFLTSEAAYTYAIIDDRPENWHVTGYYAHTQSLGFGPNVQILHFPGSELSVVSVPSRLQHAVQKVTSELPLLELLPGPINYYQMIDAHKGDFQIVTAENSGKVVEALQNVHSLLQPWFEPYFWTMIEKYCEQYPDHCFVLICHTGGTHQVQVVVEYVPYNDDVLFVPGVSSHHTLWADNDCVWFRNMRVAVGVDGIELPHQNSLHGTAKPYWIPETVAGFHDNRSNQAEGPFPNSDYLIPLEAVRMGMTGWNLLNQCC